MSYEWDVFISYPRNCSAGSWVKEHFAPLLKESLEEVLPQAPRIFIDTSMPVGADWPLSLQNALQRSKLLLPVWTPPYFGSKWCLSEWRSMREREKMLVAAGTAPAKSLIYPVVFSDGKHFHEEARNTQARQDLGSFTYPYPSFRDSVKYLEFHDVVRDIATELEERLGSCPPWAANWPLLEIEPVVQTPLNLVSL